MDDAPPFSITDWLAVAAVGVMVAWLLRVPFLAQEYMTTFEQLGGALPTLTRLALTPWGPPLLTLPAIGLTVYGLRTRASLVRRRLAIVGGVAAAAVAVGAVYWALYLPLYQLTSAITAE